MVGMICAAAAEVATDYGAGVLLDMEESRMQVLAAAAEAAGRAAVDGKRWPGKHREGRPVQV